MDKKIKSKKMDKRAQILTGDTILFSNNAPTGSILKIFVSTEWNHSGIAVRFLRLPNGKRKISLTEEGDLFVYETNTGSRYDEIHEETIVGAGYSSSEWLFKKYNKISYRKMKPEYRNAELIKFTEQFTKNNIGNRFPSTTMKFMGAWFGVSLTENDPQNKEMFCSELMTHYYSYCVGQQKIYKYENNLLELFGGDGPDLEELYVPEHYTYNKTPNSKIFDGREEMIYYKSGDLFYIILQPFILIIFIIMILWIILPRPADF